MFDKKSTVMIFCMIVCMITLSLALEMPPVVDVPSTTPLGCHRRVYTIRVSQADTKGRECWDHVSVMSCWGRCDSSEISDWRFPYKRSHHPVCVHAGRVKAVAMLRHCHPNADPETKRYEYMEAVGCNCQICSSTDTSCEALKQIHMEPAIKVLALAGPGPDDLEY